MVKEISSGNETLYQCEACGLAYRERKIAEECEQWCREHASCNIEIIKNAVAQDSPEKL
ncbi:MAG: hypothetical protein HYS74_01440 [Parcubacteria group bacterium]|nr:hypothetical protein [Parcubacteria group bacterium]